MLAVQALNQFYGGSHTLWDVDLFVPTGSRMCLMGRNGMGKTTLLKCIMGLLQTTSGTLTIDDVDLLQRPSEERASARGMVQEVGRAREGTNQQSTALTSSVFHSSRRAVRVLTCTLPACSKVVPLHEEPAADLLTLNLKLEFFE
mgnify:CR=1 FL=1